MSTIYFLSKAAPALLQTRIYRIYINLGLQFSSNFPNPTSPLAVADDS
jgi:hypothetical protein